MAEMRSRNAGQAPSQKFFVNANVLAFGKALTQETPITDTDH
jgi:hypothetical protein